MNLITNKIFDYEKKYKKQTALANEKPYAQSVIRACRLRSCALLPLQRKQYE
jgi:hypothetical protein